MRLVEQRENINELLGQASCFLSCSRAETFSYAIAEAALYGLSIIMSDIPGTAWAKKMNSVETFESENADELAEKMMDFINKNKINKKDLEQSREHILENYTTDIWGDKIISYYNELLK